MNLNVYRLLFLFLVMTLAASWGVGVGCSPPRLDIQYYFPVGSNPSFDRMRFFIRNSKVDWTDDVRDISREARELKQFECPPPNPNAAPTNPPLLFMEATGENTWLTGLFSLRLACRRLSAAIFLSPPGELSLWKRDARLARVGHQVTLMPDGQYWITGGVQRLELPKRGGSWRFGKILKKTVFYDPTTGTLKDGPELQVARAFHTAVLTPTEVLLIGGLTEREGEQAEPLASIEALPLKGNGKIILKEGSLSAPSAFHLTARKGDSNFYGGVSTDSNMKRGAGLHLLFHTATYLPKRKKVMVLGGWFFDARTDRFLAHRHGWEISPGAKSPIAPTHVNLLSVPRAGHTTTLLSDDRLFVLGGIKVPPGLPIQMTNRAELLTPTAKGFEGVEILKLPYDRAFHTATRIPGRSDGDDLLIVGGLKEPFKLHTQAIFLSLNKGDEKFRRVTFLPMPAGRFLHSSTLMSTGQVMFLGGLQPSLDSSNERWVYGTVPSAVWFNPGPVKSAPPVLDPEKIVTQEPVPVDSSSPDAGGAPEEVSVNEPPSLDAGIPELSSPPDANPGGNLKRCADKECLQWVLGIAGSGLDDATEVVLGPKGNIFVTGSFSGEPVFGTLGVRRSVGSGDVFVAMVSPKGNLLWVATAGGIGDDVASGLVVNAQGEVFVAGSFSGPEIRLGAQSLRRDSLGLLAKDGFVAKLDPSGKWLWATQIEGPRQQECVKLASDVQGGVYVVGNFEKSVKIAGQTLAGLQDNSNHIFVGRLDGKSGLFSWVSTIAQSSNDRASGLFWSTSGKLFVVGQTSTTSAKQKILLASLDAAKGTTHWVKSWEGLGFARGTAVVSNVTAQGVEAVYLAGAFHSSLTLGSTTLQAKGPQGGLLYSDIFVARLDAASGAFAWAVSGGSDQNDQPEKLALSAKGDALWLSGFVEEKAVFGTHQLNFSGQADLLVAKLNAADGRWLGAIAKGSSNLFAPDVARTFVLTPEQHIVVAGSIAGPVDFFGTGLFQLPFSTTNNAFLWKFSQPW